MVIPGQKILRTMFGVDLRSVALLRIGLAVMLLADLAISAQHLRAFYTDDGVLPRNVLLDFSPYPSGFFSLHLAGGSAGFEGALFALHAALALALLVGWHTRLAALGCYGLLLSLEARNPMVLFGADMMLRLGLFWAIFLPLGDRCSVDAALGRVRPAKDNTWLGVASFAFIFQLGLAYAFSALLKTGSTWRVDHTAVSYALALDIYRRPFGQWLGQFDGLTHAMTVGVLWLELYGPLLFILPCWNRWARLLGVVLFAGLQAGFGSCMQMGFFGPVMVALSLVLLPAEFWSGCAAPLGRRLAAWPPAARVAGWWRRRLERRRHAPRPELPAPAWRWRTARALGWLRDGVLLALVAFIVGFNVQQIPGQRQLVPASLNWLAYDAGLDQEFGVFAPNPQVADGWFVMRGTMKNGRTVNVFTGESPATLDKPADVPASFGGERWMAYLIFIWSPGSESFYEPLALHLGNEWNRTHPGDEQLSSLEIILMAEPTLPDLTKPQPEERLLWTEFF